MRVEIQKDDINGSLQSLFWSMGIFDDKEKGTLLPIKLKAHNDVLELCVCSNKNFFRCGITARVTELGEHTVTFAWLKNICDRLLTNNMMLYTDGNFVYLKTEECKVALPADIKEMEPLPPGSSEKFLSISPAFVNQIAMQMHCISPMTAIFFHPDKKELWFESISEAGNCMAKIALQDGDHAGFSVLVDSEKFMYMTRGLAALNASHGRIIQQDDGIWLKTTSHLMRLSSEKGEAFGASHKVWLEESKESQNITLSRKGVIHILESCVVAQPKEKWSENYGMVAIDSFDHAGNTYARFTVDGLYKMSRITHTSNGIAKQIKVPIGPMLKFIKTYDDPVVKLVITGNYLYVVKENARLGLCLN